MSAAAAGALHGTGTRYDDGVSVVVVARNAREHVLRCLASLRAQADLPYEVILVDDASRDGTIAAVEQAFPQTRVLAHRDRRGLAVGRNAALPLVSRRFVLMLDADTELRGSLRSLAEVLDREPGVGLVAPRLVYPDGRLQLSCFRYPPLLQPFVRRGPYARLNPDPPMHRWHLMKDYDHEQARAVVWVLGAAQMWRSDLPARIGGYDERISSFGGEDIDWCLRVWRAGLEVRYVPETMVMHVAQRVTRKSMYGRESWRAFCDWFYVQWKHRRLRHDQRLRGALA
jgi:GT2 family glycosyltransferase